MRPLPDAAIWVDVSVDVYQAFTKTNDAGGFFLCRLDAPVRIDVELGGFVGASLSLGSGEQAPLEIELKRR